MSTLMIPADQTFSWRSSDEIYFFIDGFANNIFKCGIKRLRLAAATASCWWRLEAVRRCNIVKDAIDKERECADLVNSHYTACHQCDFWLNVYKNSSFDGFAIVAYDAEYGK